MAGHIQASLHRKGGELLNRAERGDIAPFDPPSPSRCDRFCPKGAAEEGTAFAVCKLNHALFTHPLDDPC
ncbi:hypothetical protein [Streptomyces triticisoli]|jgi:hypothetical protein|uniref:hypothetical protein n=1 Tax=Streptomyces triticisoli TaxID=2182797 RepID=UPI0013004F41|nr:hypothetical protein [Streptomyces triticisoli]